MGIFKKFMWSRVSRKKRMQLFWLAIIVLSLIVLVFILSNPLKGFANLANEYQSETESNVENNATGLDQFAQNMQQEQDFSIRDFISNLFRKKQESSLELTAAGEEPQNEPEEESISSVSGELVVRFVDVGQGDCTLITQGEDAVMIDTGYYMQKEACESALYSAGISNFSLILTHPDADHIGNADALCRDFYVSEVLMPDFKSNTTVYEINMKAFEDTGTPYEYVAAGDEYILGGAKIRFFGPVTLPEDPEDTNNASLMMKIEFGDTSFLIIGDAEIEEQEETFKWAKDNKFDLSCDVLKCGHHGSWNSLYEPLYRAAGASHYIISCGRDNEYGHPSDSVIKYLERSGGTYYLTEGRYGIPGRGTITATSNGSAVRWSFSDDEAGDDSLIDTIMNAA